jgi:hypothetical protein
LARFKKFLKAVGVESVAARQELDGVSGGVEGVQANRTIVAGGVQSAPVCLEGRRFHANPTLVAVRVVLSAADPTNPALVAVELSLTIAIGKRNFVIQKNTDRAPVGAKNGVATIADRMGFLHHVASHTLDGLDRMSVHRMRFFYVFFSLIVLVVVTKPTADIVSTAGGQQGGLSPIMGAALIGGGHYYE